MSKVFNNVEIVNFFLLQEKLVRAFFKAYPTVKDMEWLLDFPKSGCIQVNDEIWNFSKHGKGIKFVMENSHVIKIVDMHSHINCPEYVDTWRLAQYFSIDDEEHLKRTLDEMVVSGKLKKVSNKLYRLKEILPTQIFENS